MAPPVLRHRVIASFNAEAAGQTSDDIVVRLLQAMRTDGGGGKVGPEDPAGPRPRTQLRQLWPHGKDAGAAHPSRP